MCQAEEAAVASTATQAKFKAAKDKARRRKGKAETKALGKAEDKDANKEKGLMKRLTKLVGAAVVECMLKHSKLFDRDSFKKHAKNVYSLFSSEKRILLTFVS